MQIFHNSLKWELDDNSRQLMYPTNWSPLQCSQWLKFSHIPKNPDLTQSLSLWSRMGHIWVAFPVSTVQRRVSMTLGPSCSKNNSCYRQAFGKLLATRKPTTLSIPLLVTRMEPASSPSEEATKGLHLAITPVLSNISCWVITFGGRQECSRSNAPTASSVLLIQASAATWVTSSNRQRSALPLLLNFLSVGIFICGHTRSPSRGWNLDHAWDCTLLAARNSTVLFERAWSFFVFRI